MIESSDFKILNEKDILTIANIVKRYATPLSKYNIVPSSLEGLQKAFTVQGNFTQCVVKNGTKIGVGASKLNMVDVEVRRYKSGKKEGQVKKTIVNSPETGEYYAFARAIKNYIGILENGVKHKHFKLDRRVKAKQQTNTKTKDERPEGNIALDQGRHPEGNPKETNQMAIAE